MGKKSRRPNKAAPGAKPPSDAPDAAYPSDGPSEEELNSLQTSSPSLQAKLDLLTDLALANDRGGFVNQFVPLDLTASDIAGYLQDLTTAPEADGQWKNLISEIAVIAAGRGVKKIEGDQVKNAVFFFQNPIFKECDREVSFNCTNGEWRAEG
jgi:hypothetical protein